MIIYLVNRFFNYAITKTNLNSTKQKSDFFIYIISERYALDKFYSIMIDTEALKQSTAGYGKYLAYKKNITYV